MGGKQTKKACQTSCKLPTLFGDQQIYYSFLELHWNYFYKTVKFGEHATCAGLTPVN
jgi:hypothetical protein